MLNRIEDALSLIADPRAKVKAEKACLALIRFLSEDRHGNIIFSAKDGVLSNKVKKEIIATIE